MLVLSTVYSVIAILAQRLVIQGHYNDTLSDQSKCYKNNHGMFYCDLVIKLSLPALPSLVLEAYTDRTG